MLFVSSKLHTTLCFRSCSSSTSTEGNQMKPGRARDVGASETVEEVLLSGAPTVEPKALSEGGLCLSSPSRLSGTFLLTQLLK